MTRARWITPLVLFAVAAGSLLGLRALKSQEKQALVREHLFEMRTYTTHRGKLDDLHQRFREHTIKLFQKHGITMLGFWTPAEGERSRDTLIYILAYPDLDAREKSWKAFQDDPEWKKARSDSEAHGPIVAKVDSVYLRPTDYSPVR